MASRKPLVMVAGQIQQLQAGDTLNAAVSEVDIVSMTNDNAGSIVIGAPVYVDDDDGVDKARANAMSTADVLGLVKDATVATTAAANIQTDGVLAATTTQWDAVTGQTGGLTASVRYYLDPSTAGKLTTTAPTTVGQVVICIGKALSATEMELAIGDPVLL